MDVSYFAQDFNAAWNTAAFPRDEENILQVLLRPVFDAGKFQKVHGVRTHIRSQAIVFALQRFSIVAFAPPLTPAPEGLQHWTGVLPHSLHFHLQA